jgi:branched-chain amino acid transport system ATP-binding protein/branched-chain amino acid transport system permease protein
MNRANLILSQVGLTSIALEYVRTVGWEERRRLEVARAVALRPRVLLLDEPTAGMHAESLERFTALIRAIAGTGVAVVLIEHNVSFILASTEVLYAMDSGSIIAFGEPESVLKDAAVSDSYLGAKPA